MFVPEVDLGVAADDQAAGFIPLAIKPGVMMEAVALAHHRHQWTPTFPALPSCSRLSADSFELSVCQRCSGCRERLPLEHLVFNVSPPPPRPKNSISFGLELLPVLRHLVSEIVEEIRVDLMLLVIPSMKKSLVLLMAARSPEKLVIRRLHLHRAQALASSVAIQCSRWCLYLLAGWTVVSACGIPRMSVSVLVAVDEPTRYLSCCPVRNATIRTGKLVR